MTLTVQITAKSVRNKKPERGFLKECLGHLTRNKASFPRPGSVLWRSSFQQKCKIWSTYWHVWGRRQWAIVAHWTMQPVSGLSIQSCAHPEMSNQSVSETKVQQRICNENLSAWLSLKTIVVHALAQRHWQLPSHPLPFLWSHSWWNYQ